MLTNPFERSGNMYVDKAVEAANLEAMVFHLSICTYVCMKDREVYVCMVSTRENPLPFSEARRLR